MNGSRMAPRIRRLKRVTRNSSRASAMPSTILAVSAAAVNHEGVLQRLLEDRAGEASRSKLPSPTKLPDVPDAGVAEAEPHREHEGIGDQERQQEERRRDEPLGCARITRQEACPAAARDRQRLTRDMTRPDSRSAVLSVIGASGVRLDANYLRDRSDHLPRSRNSTRSARQVYWK